MLWWDKFRTRKTGVGSTLEFESNLKLRADHLNHILQRERTRADRSGHPLTMLLVGYEGKSVKRKDASAIVHVMQKRARITDEIGWFDQHTGFAVLPDTPVEGGRQFAEIIRKQLRERGIKMSFAIYQYAPPSKHPDNDQDSSGTGTGSRQLPMPGVSNKPDRRRRASAHAVAMSRHKDQLPQELTPFLAQKLPWWKRATDVVVAGSALAVCWPLLAAIAVAIKLDSPGPAIFKQQRAGLGNQPFSIWKFRTMRPDAEKLRDQLLEINEQDGPAFKIKADPRITRIGAFLRKTSLDELPQLINVLRGEMTLVGPRPLPVHESDACESWQKRRLDVTPGLTCIWQVWGRSSVTFSEWVRMDLRYQRLRSPNKDLRILIATVPAVLKQRGAC